MFNAFAHDLSLYGRLVLMQIRAQAQYKLNLTLDIFCSFAITVLEFIALLLFFVAFPNVLGWNIGEVALLTSMMSFCFGLAEMAGAGIENFAETIRHGEFDRVLLRPVNVVIQVVGSDFRLRRLGRMFQGLLGFGVALYLLPGLQWTIGKFLALALGIASGMLIFIAILFLGATICFWTIETTELINSLYYGARTMLSYPMTIYDRGLQGFFLFVVPVAFGSYLPTCYILGKTLPFDLPRGLVFASPFAACAFALIAGLIWSFGVRHYQSSGS